MGYYKKQLMEFMDDGICREFETAFDESGEIKSSIFFAYEVWETLKESDRQTPEPLTKEFLYDIFPKMSGREYIWAMAAVGNDTYNFSFRNVDSALRGFGTLINENINLYFSPAIFTGWRVDKNVSRINTIYIDIDDINGIDFSNMSEADIVNYLVDTFDLPQDLLPNWCVCSGHGLHLYYLVDEMNLKDTTDTEERLKYTDYLITYFKADTSCRNKSRILRFPNSRNVKNMDDIRITRLFHLNQSTDRSIRRLDYFATSENIINNYIAECNAHKAEKRRQTMLANGTIYQKKSSEAPLRAPKPEPVKSKSAKELPKNTECPSLWIPPHPELKVYTSPLPSTARYKKIIRDLHNWAARRRGVPAGYRAIFTHILAVFLKRMNVDEEIAVIRAEEYLDADFMEEAETIIRNVYSTKTKYMYRNERIAELLDFTEEDLKDSFCAYTEKQRKKAHQKAVNEYEYKRFNAKRQAAYEKRQTRYEYIRRHSGDTVASLAKELKCSERTIRYYKAKLKKENGM